MNPNIDLIQMGKDAKVAARQMAHATTEQKNRALQRIADGLKNKRKEILAANQKDITEAETAGMSQSLLDRLSLQENRLEGIIDGVHQVIKLPNPVGEVIESSELPNGLKVSKVRTPIGVLGIIYEARPNVTIDIAALSIKSGNCAILRGGSETLHSNKALAEVIRQALQDSELPANAIQLIESPNRDLVLKLLHLHDYVDLIIPRGGAGLHQFCRQNSSIPVITGGIGICHLFVDEDADFEQALEVIHNAKTQRPSVCNALDTILVHQRIASQFIPKVINKLKKSGVTFRVDSQALKFSPTDSEVQLAGAQDFDTEWLSLVLGIKVVSNIHEAIEHIHEHSTGHSDGILTNVPAHAEQFVNEVDSAAVYVNASTRFTDGGQLGLGSEVAISTQKLHARGPMGLRELTSYKWVIRGNYHVRR